MTHYYVYSPDNDIGSKCESYEEAIDSAKYFFNHWLGKKEIKIKKIHEDGFITTLFYTSKGIEK